jgi:hypothetical protein
VESSRLDDDGAAGAHEDDCDRPRLQEADVKPLIILIVCACAVLALVGCGSSSDEGSSATAAPTQAAASAQDRAASQVCSARGDIQTQVQTLTSLSAGSATKADVTTALSAIQTDLQKMKNAQPDLAPERKQQVQDAATAFGTQLKDVLKQTVAGLSKTDAQTQAKNAAASLESAVKESLQPIAC